MKKTIAYRRLSAEFCNWCEEEHVPNDRRITELTEKMLGGSSSVTPHPGHLMKVKAAEVSVLLPFAVHAILVLHPGQLTNGNELAEAGKALCRYLDIVREAGANVTVEEHNQLMDCMVRRHVLAELAAVHPSPKYHLCIHLTARIGGSLMRSWYLCYTCGP